MHLNKSAVGLDWSQDQRTTYVETMLRGSIRLSNAPYSWETPTSDPHLNAGGKIQNLHHEAHCANLVTNDKLTN